MLGDLFPDYLLELKARRDPKTVAKHEYLLRGFVRFVGERAVDRRLWLGYITHLKESGYTPWTVHTAAQVARRFLDWCADEGRLPQRITKPSDIPKQPEPKPNPMSEGEVQRLLRLLEAERDWLGKRDYALCVVLLDTGLRLAETLQITVQMALDGNLLVRQKGGRYLHTYLSEPSQRAVRRYLRAYQQQTRQKLAEQDLLWRDRTHAPLTANGVKKRFQALSRQVGFRVHAHRFRATSITWRLEQGASTELVREAVGHRDERSIRSYAQLAEPYKRQLLQASSPLHRLR